MKISKETFKQITLTFIALTLILLGYANYSFNNKGEVLEVASRNDNEINLGDVELVSCNSVDENYMSGIVPNEKTNEINNNDYFEETRIERDRMYSESLETYQKLIDSTQTPQDQKAIASQEIANITNKKNSIVIIENLIKNKGFEDVVVLENNGNISVIIKASNLTQEEISKIQNIVSRELNADVANINISNK